MLCLDGLKVENTTMAYNSLVLETQVALIDEGLLEVFACKKAQLIRKDLSVCEYYVLDVHVPIQELTNDHKRLRAICQQAMIRMFSHVVIITK